MLTQRGILNLLAVVLAVLLVYVALIQLERWRWQRSMESLISAQSDDFDQTLQQFAALPSILSRDPRLLRVLLSPSRSAVTSANESLKFASQASGTAAIFLMDARGKTLAASNFDQDPSFVGRNYAFRPYFKDAMEGHQATFFAVGATTGIPGYFVANPIHTGNHIAGVVVVKVEPRALPAVWNHAAPYLVITDELGMTILASDSKFLYAPSRTLQQSELELIRTERRYPLLSKTQFSRLANRQWLFSSGKNYDKAFHVTSHRITTEPWHLHALRPIQDVRWYAIGYLAMLLAVFALTALMLRSFRQQRQLFENREQQARGLELLVQQRTQALEDAQQALIAESNFSMLGRMSAAINHEINQPLASLRLNLATLRQIVDRQINPDHDLHDIVIESDRTTKRIGRVIETLRSVARQGKSGFDFVDMQKVASDAAETVRRERPLANNALRYKQLSPIDLTRDAPQAAEVDRQMTDPPMADLQATDQQVPDLYVTGNEVLLQQAVLNLLYNALDAVVESPAAEARVSLELHLSGQSVKLSVTDNGKGLAAEMQERLFKPFESEGGKHSGLGLGLTLAQQIASDHNGELDYQQAPGGGSLFTLSIPRNPQAKKSVQ